MVQVLDRLIADELRRVQEAREARNARDVESVRKAYKYKLKPTPEQERQLEEVLWRCRTRYNTAVGAAYHRLPPLWRHALALPAGSGVEGPPRRLPEYAAIHSHVFRMCWPGSTRRIRRSSAASRPDKTPGFPRFQGRGRYHSFTYKEYGNGATPR